MEFRFRAGEERIPLLRPRSSLPDGYLPPQPLRAGFVGIAPEMGRADLMHPVSAFGALRRELQKERIREEIIARENTERRILEEEVRREMAIERSMGIRRIPMAETMMLAQLPQDRVAEGLAPGQILHVSGVAVDEGLPLRVSPNAVVGKELPLVHHKTDSRTVKPSPVREVVSIDESLPFWVNPNAVVGRELALVHHQTDPKTVDPLPVMEPVDDPDVPVEFVPAAASTNPSMSVNDPTVPVVPAMPAAPDRFDYNRSPFGCLPTQPRITSTVAPRTQKASGIKRKGEAVVGGSKLTRKAVQQSWGCALCQVSATCEGALNEHLQGRRHKSKVSQLDGSSKAGASGGASSSGSNVKHVVAAIPQGAMEVDMKVDGTMHKVVRKDGFLWCERCRIKCNSTLMMAAHLSGKRHITRMGGAAPAVVATTTITEAAAETKEAEEEEEDGEDQSGTVGPAGDERPDDS